MDFERLDDAAALRIGRLGMLKVQFFEVWASKRRKLMENQRRVSEVLAYTESGSPQIFLGGKL